MAANTGSWSAFFCNWDGNALITGGGGVKARVSENWDTFRLNYAIVALVVTIGFSIIGISRIGAVIMGLITVAWHMMIRLTPAEAAELARIEAEEDKKEAERLEKLYGPVKKKE